MIYELRVYRAVPGRMPDLLKRFENHTLKFWQEQGIRQVGFWTTMIGPSNQELFYILAWESLEERQRKWDKFAADPQWLKVRGETEKDGPIVELASNSILSPTKFSAMQ